jgi:hypothetical protein
VSCNSICQPKALGPHFSTCKAKALDGLSHLESGDSYHLFRSQLWGKWNITQLLLWASYQIQTQTDTVWLSCSRDLFTQFRRKCQVISELWQQPAGSQHIPAIKIVYKEHQAPGIITLDCRKVRTACKMLEDLVPPTNSLVSYFAR